MEQKKRAVIAACIVGLVLQMSAFAAEQPPPESGDQSDAPAVENAGEQEAYNEDALEENPEDTSRSAPSRPAYSEEIKQEVKRAEALYRKAVIQHARGNNEKAGELFGKSLKMLSAVPLDHYAFSAMHPGLDSIFRDLTLLFNADGNAAGGKKYTIPIDKDNEQVKKYLQLYSSGETKARIKAALERSGRYRPMILNVLREYGLPEELIYLPVVESLYNVNDRSWAGAVGLWQFMGHRARDFNLRMNFWIDERKDPEKSTRAAAQYLRDLYYMFDNWHLALAAYNRGEYGLARDLQFSKATNIEQMSERRAVPRETGNYVPQFIACTIIGDDPEAYGFDLHYEPQLIYDEVSLDKIVDLEVAAKCAGTDVASLKALNPALKAWCTPHNYPGFVLKIPSGARDLFLSNLAQVKELNPSRGFIKYRVERGDYLGKIAKKFGTSVSALKEDNRIKNDRHLRIGQVLVVRPGRKYAQK